MANKDYSLKLNKITETIQSKKAFDLLPSWMQTSEQIQKFFDDAVDQWFTPESTEMRTGYVGKPYGNNSKDEIYLSERNDSREFYQLAPMFASVDDENDILTKTFYPDVINYLDTKGVLTNNHERITQGKYYSWDAPINFDMILNYNNYVWINDMSLLNINIYDPITIVVTIEPELLIDNSFVYPSGTYKEFKDNNLDIKTQDYSNIPLKNGDIILFESVSGTFYEPKVPYQANVDENGIIESFSDVRTNFKQDIIGKTQYIFANGLKIKNGHRLTIKYDVSEDLNEKTFIISGVGKSIELLEDNYNPFTQNSTVPEYIVMERGAKDGNLWSRTNNWVHIDVIHDSTFPNINYTMSDKPIIEYFNNLKLVNFGTTAREDVDYTIIVDDVTNFLHPIDFIHELNDNQSLGEMYYNKTILFKSTNTSNADSNLDKIYRVEKLNREDSTEDDDLYVLSTVITANNPNGEPIYGDTVLSLDSLTHYYYNGSEWITGQYKGTENSGHNQYIFFEVIDSVTEEIIDIDKFNHNGCTIVQYNQQDKELKYATDLIYNSFGSVEFELTSETRYDNSIEFGVEDYYRSVWTLAETDTIQKAVKIYNTIQTKTEQDIDVIENEFILPYGTNKSEIVVYKNEQLVDHNNYNRTEDFIETLVFEEEVELTEFDVIRVELNSTGRDTINDAFFDIPLNLSTNALNETFDIVSVNEIFEHLSSTIINQNNFEGVSFGINNYNNTEKDNSKGTQLIRHINSMIPLMAHTSEKKYDIINAIEFTKIEYIRFYNKFKNKLTQLYNSEPLYSSIGAEEYIRRILSDLNVSKSEEFPFWYSEMAFDGACIPPTPSYFGITQSYVPQFHGNYIIAHDGSYVEKFNDYNDPNNEFLNRDEILLFLETMIFNSIRDKFKNEDYISRLDKFDFKPSPFRETIYSEEEYKELTTKQFEEYAIINEINYKDHIITDDWKTWNWSNTIDLYGDTVSGSYRSIFYKFFDTFTPNETPWECLGFSQKPSWWDLEYSDHTPIDEHMWSDIKEGIIRRGLRQGTYDKYKRPFINVSNGIGIPVSVDYGELLSPYECGLVNSEPSELQKSTRWKIGDYSETEYNYITGIGSSFINVVNIFLNQPVKFGSSFWDTLNSPIKNDLDNTFNEYQLTDLEGYVLQLDEVNLLGYSIWVTEKLISDNYSIQEYQDIINGSSVRLGNKLGGFTTQQQVVYTSDNFGLVPQENINVSMFTSSVINQPIYSGVNVVYRNGKYEVYGFDVDSGKFKFNKPSYSGKKVPVEINGKTFIKHVDFNKSTSTIEYNTQFNSRQEVYEFIRGYGNYLESQGWIFEDESSSFTLDWEQMGIVFLTWSLGNLSENDFVNLSTGLNEIKYQVEHGSVQSVAQNIGGSWAILDQDYNGIRPEELNTNRIGSIFSVNFEESSQTSINLLKLNIREYEHVVIFDNTTEFNDTLYIPKYGIFQERLRLSTTITGDWNGRLEAGGYVVLEDGTLPNFEKLVNDFRNYYDPSSSTNSVTIDELSRKLIGYRTRTYLQNLSLDEVEQYNMYQGFIKDKGTKNAMTRALRSLKFTDTTDFNIQEEWAFKIAEYGQLSNDLILEFRIKPEDINQYPQVFCFGETNLYPNSVYFPNNSINWITHNKLDKFGSDLTAFSRPVIYDEKTDITNAIVNYWNPHEDIILGRADKEIKYKSTIDPSIYSSNFIDDGDHIIHEDGWKESHIGELWWNKEGLKYVDITDDISQAREDWGKIESGEIVIMEWVKSPVLPIFWNDYVTEQSDLNKDSDSWIPSGEPVLINSGESELRYKVVTEEEYDYNSNSNKTWYYFWVKNPITTPNVKFRNIPASEVTTILKDPTSLNLPWFAPLNETTFIMAGMAEFVTNDFTILQMSYKEDSSIDTVSHKEWELIQDNNPTIMNEYLWKTLSDSLLGYVEIKNNTTSVVDIIEDNTNEGYISIPSLDLIGKHKYGNSVKTAYQSLFTDISEARRNFIDIINVYYKENPIISNSEIFPYIETVTYINDSQETVTINLEELGYWTKTDWYKEGISELSVDYKVDTIEERNNISFVKVNDIVQVNHVDGWIMYQYTKDRNDYFWNSVGAENATIEFTDKLFKESLDPYNRPMIVTETEAVLSNILETLTDIQSTVFISMAEYALHEQLSLDWGFKTSYVYITGQVTILDDRIISADTSEVSNIFDYFEEVKPYRTKIRSRIEETASEIDIAKVEVQDSNTKEITLLYDFISCRPDSYEYLYDENGYVVYESDLHPEGSNVPVQRRELLESDVESYKKLYRQELYNIKNGTFKFSEENREWKFEDNVWIPYDNDQINYVLDDNFADILGINSMYFNIRMQNTVNRIKMSNPELSTDDILVRLGCGYKGYNLTGELDVNPINEIYNTVFDIQYDINGKPSYVNPEDALEVLSNDEGFNTFVFDNDETNVIYLEDIDVFDVTNKINVFYVNTNTSEVINVPWELISNQEIEIDTDYIKTELEFNEIHVSVLDRNFYYDRIIESSFNEEYQDGTERLINLDRPEEIIVNGGELISNEKQYNRSESLSERADTSVKEGFSIKLFETDTAAVIPNNGNDASIFPLNWQGYESELSLSESTIDLVCQNLVNYTGVAISSGTLAQKKTIRDTASQKIEDIIERIIDNEILLNGTIEDNERYVYDQVQKDFNIILDNINSIDFSENITQNKVQILINIINQSWNKTITLINTYMPYATQVIIDVQLLIDSCINILSNDNLLNYTNEYIQHLYDLKTEKVKQNIYHLSIRNLQLYTDISNNITSDYIIIGQPSTDRYFNTFDSTRQFIFYNNDASSVNRDLLVGIDLDDYKQEIATIDNETKIITYHEGRYYVEYDNITESDIESGLTLQYKNVKVAFDVFEDSDVYISEEIDSVFTEYKKVTETMSSDHLFTINDVNGTNSTFDYGHDAFGYGIFNEFFFNVTTYEDFTYRYVVGEDLDEDFTFLGPNDNDKRDEIQLYSYEGVNYTLNNNDMWDFSSIQPDGSGHTLNVYEHSGTLISPSAGLQFPDMNVETTPEFRTRPSDNLIKRIGLRYYIDYKGQPEILRMGSGNNSNSSSTLVEDLGFTDDYNDILIFATLDDLSGNVTDPNFGNTVITSGNMPSGIDESEVYGVVSSVNGIFPVTGDYVLEGDIVFWDVDINDWKLARNDIVVDDIDQITEGNTSGFVWINDECIHYSDIIPSQNRLVHITRGINNTTIQTHNQNDIVFDGTDTQVPPSVLFSVRPPLKDRHKVRPYDKEQFYDKLTIVDNLMGREAPNSEYSELDTPSLAIFLQEDTLENVTDIIKIR